MGDLKRKHKPTLQVCSTFSLRLFFLFCLRMTFTLVVIRKPQNHVSYIFITTLFFYFIFKTEGEKTKMRSTSLKKNIFLTCLNCMNIFHNKPHMRTHTQTRAAKESDIS